MTIPNEQYVSLVESCSDLSDHEFSLLVAEQLIARAYAGQHVDIDTLRIEELIEQIRFYMLDYYGIKTQN